MIDGAEVTASVVELLQSDATLSSLGIRMANVERDEYPNRDGERVPWIGVYQLSEVYEPRAIGQHSVSWEDTVEVLILAQVSHLRSAQDCADRMGAVVQAIIAALWRDPTWGGEVDMLSAVSVRHLYDRDDTASLYWRQAEITFTARVSTG